MPNKNSHLNRWLIAGGILLLIIVFVLFVDVKAVLDLLLSTNWLLWLGSVLFLLVGFALTTVRWRHLLAGKPGWLPLFQGDSIAYMINMITPIPVMVSRIVTTNRTTPVSISQATSGMVVDRLLESMMRLLGFMLGLVVLAAQLTEANAYGTILAYLGLFALAIAGLVWLRNHHELVTDKLSAWLGRLPWLNEVQVRKTVGKFLQGLAYAGSTHQLTSGLLLSIGMWSFFLVFQYLALVALPPAMPFRDGLLIALVVLVVVPPSTPAMVGLYHAIVVGALVGLGLMNINRAITYAILLHLPQMVIWLILGNWALRVNHIRLRELLHASRARTSQGTEGSEAEVSPG
jgi:uncharacterized protein (TIRG00374 family)